SSTDFSLCILALCQGRCIVKFLGLKSPTRNFPHTGGIDAHGKILLGYLRASFILRALRSGTLTCPTAHPVARHETGTVVPVFLIALIRRDWRQLRNHPKWNASRAHRNHSSG